MYRQKADFYLALVAGILEALLLARLVLQLFAARQSNPVVAGLMAITHPLVMPFAQLDRDQPHFGAVLEFSTLTSCAVILILWMAGTLLARRLS